MKLLYPCEDKACKHYRPYHIQDLDRFIGAFYERLLWCLTCSRNKGVDRMEEKWRGRPRKEVF